MPFVPVANVAESELRMLLGGERVENTLAFQHDGAILASDLSDLNDALKHWWTVDYAPLTWDATQLREIYSADQTTSTGPASTLDGGGEHGAGGSNVVANNVTVVVSFRTDFRGRSFRGRNYIAGIPTPQFSDANHIESSYATSLISAYNSLLGPDALVTGFTWGVVSRFSGVDVNHKPIPRVAGVFTPITQVVITDLVADSQRRRLPGRGD
jgi:hypothetical protein